MYVAENYKLLLIYKKVDNMYRDTQNISTSILYPKYCMLLHPYLNIFKASLWYERTKFNTFEVQFLIFFLNEQPFLSLQVLQRLILNVLLENIAL